MAKLGDDVLEWQTDKLVQWLQQEGMDDCILPFTSRKLNGRSLVNLAEVEIKSLHHVSQHSKKKLIKTIERFKRKKKEKMAAMFGGQRQVQTVNTRKPPSFCQEDEAGSDDEGWGTDEWDSDDDSQDASSEGEYLEPEEDLTKRGSLGRKSVPSVPSGLVAQLRAGIASSLTRPQKPPAPQDQYHDDEDIYDEPPEEEELYDEPSDNSGGAVVVRPPKRTPKGEGEYLHPREMDGEQDTYEFPEEETPRKPPARPDKDRRFIPTKVVEGKKFVPVNKYKDENEEMYDVPDIEEPEEDDDDSYEIPGEQAVPPPRPPKGSGAPVNAPKPTTFSKPSGWPPQKPQISPAGKTFKAPPPQPSIQPQGVPGRFPGPNTRPQQNSLSTQGTQLRPQPTPPAQTRFQPPLARKPQPEQKKPDFPPKTFPLPKTISPGGQEKSPPVSPVKSAGGSMAPGPGPRPIPRTGILNKMEAPPRALATEAPSKSPRGPPALPPATHRKQAPLPTTRPPPPEPRTTPVEEPVPSRSFVPPQQQTEPVPPARPPKAGPFGNSSQPVLPPKHPGDNRQGVPLPAPPPAMSREKEQSSASSIDSNSADDPITSLQHQTKPGRRSLPALPPTETKSSLEMMKEAPWFQGPVDRKAAEASLMKSSQNGAFLVRNSTKSPNDYSMSLIYNRNVRHLRIPHKSNKYVLGDSGIQQFDSIIDLVNHFRQNEVDLKTGGKTKLTIPCQVYKS